MKKKKYYHASKVLFKPGDQLVPNLPRYKANFNFSCAEYIYLTEAPEPHYTVADRANEEGWYVYEVVPTGKVYVGICWDEWFTKMPCIIKKRIGNARGISKSGKPSKTSGEKSMEEWYKEKLQKAKEALKSEEARKEFEEYWEKTPESVIKEIQAKLKYKNPKTSKAMYIRTPPCTILNFNSGYRP
jgi:hypothetical protein